MEIGAIGVNATMQKNETDDAYHASEGISASGIKLFHESPRKFWAHYIEPDPEAEEDEKEKEHFLIGKAGHCGVLEPWRFDDSFVEMPKGIKKKTKAELQYWNEFQEKHAGKKILKYESMRIVKRCSEAILKHESSILIRMGKGIAECSIRWVDPVTGVLRKIRPDYFVPPCDVLPYGAIFDLKFVDDASPEGFMKAAYNHGYHVQTVQYQDGIMEFYGTKERAPFIFICAEKKYPWLVASYEADWDFIEKGKDIIASVLPRYADCLATGEWPGYPKGIQKLNLPVWARKKEKYREW